MPKSHSLPSASRTRKHIVKGNLLDNDVGVYSIYILRILVCSTWVKSIWLRQCPTVDQQIY